MSFFENPLSNLRQVKGAPLSILVALYAANPQPVKAKWLCAVTGYSPNIITTALILLEELQEVTSDTHRSNWRLTHGVRQLPLGPLPLENPDRENRDLNPSTTATTSIRRESTFFDESEGAEEALSNPDRVNRDPNSGNNQDELSIIRDLLWESGIGEPLLSKFLIMDHITLKYCLAHVTRARLDGDPTNILVHRLRSNDFQPETNNHDHATGCACEICEPYGYTTCDLCSQYHRRDLSCETSLDLDTGPDINMFGHPIGCDCTTCDPHNRRRDTREEE